VTGDSERADLERRLDAVEEAVHDLQETVSLATNRDIPLLKGTVRSLVDADIESLDELPDAGRTFRRCCADREERLQAVESHLEALGDAGAANSTKAEKYSAVLSFAHNKRNGNAKVAVSPAEIKGCTGVTRRYAYDLLDEMAADVAGVQVREAHQVETGSGVKRKGKALLVDCEDIHADVVGVNQFTKGGDGSNGR
jgi:hypothetical protein